MIFTVSQSLRGKLLKKCQHKTRNFKKVLPSHTMSRLLNRSHRQINLIYQICATQQIKRLNSTSTIDLLDDDNKSRNQELITDLLKYAKERIIEPEQREFSFRPRYKRLTIDESHLSPSELIGSGTDNYLTVNDFMLGKILPINLAQNGIDYLHDFMPYWAAVLAVPFLAKFAFTIPVTLYAQYKQDKILPLIPTAMKDYRKAADKYKADREKFNMLTDKIRFVFHD